LISNISVDWGVVAAVAEDQPKAVDAPTDADEDDTFVMVDGEESGGATGKGKERQKTLNIFDETVDPVQLDSEPLPPPPPVVLAPPPQVQQSPFKIRTLSPGNRLNVYAILQGKCPSWLHIGLHSRSIYDRANRPRDSDAYRNDRGWI
jgi:hypothetical protein